MEFKIKGREGYKVVPVASRLADFLLTEYDLLHKIRTDVPFLIRPEKANGKYRYRWDLKTRWRNFRKKHGWEWVKIHTLRHTFITLALSTPGGPTVEHISQWTGTEVTELMRTYAHLIDGGSALIDEIP